MSFVPLLYRKTHNITKSPEFKYMPEKKWITTLWHILMYMYIIMKTSQEPKGTRKGVKTTVQSSCHKNANINFEIRQIFVDVYWCETWRFLCINGWNNLPIKSYETQYNRLKGTISSDIVFINCLALSIYSLCVATYSFHVKFVFFVMKIIKLFLFTSMKQMLNCPDFTEWPNLIYFKAIESI